MRRSILSKIFLLVLILSVSLTGCVEEVTSLFKVSSVSLSKSELTLEEGANETIIATLEPELALNKVVTWSSSNDMVATVVSGQVKAVKAGTATITVTTTDGGFTATCVVTVTKPSSVDVTEVTLNKSTLSLEEGSSETLTYTISPSDATNKGVSWSSNRDGVARVDESGKVTAVRTGTATITVTTDDGSKTATCIVTVKAATVDVTGVTLNKQTLSLEVGSSETLIDSVLPSNATNKNVTWRSDRDNVAKVDGSGRVTAERVGTATITVITADGGLTASCVVTVKEATANVTGVTLDKSTLSLVVGSSEPLLPIISPDNATNKNVTWISNRPNVATVDANGVVKAERSGSATITVTTVDGNKTATCVVTVTDATIEVTDVTINKATLSLEEGSSETLTYTILPSNATNKDATWSSNRPNVATVDANGVVKAERQGSATITVTTADGNMRASCVVTVTSSTVAVTGVTLNKSTLSLEVGSSETLTQTIAPSNATTKGVSWSSNRPGVARVEADGKVTAVSAGSATITVTTDDGEKTATCVVTVSAATVAVTGVTLSAPTLSLEVGVSGSLTAIIAPENASNKNVTWNSSRRSVATVNGGVVTAVGVGTTTITVTTADGNKTATCAVTVTAATVSVTGVTLNKQTLSLNVGGEETLTANVAPTNATNRAVTWSSDRRNVATVDGNGKVVAIGIGTATITVTTGDGGKTDICTVTVNAESQPPVGSNIVVAYTMQATNINTSLVTHINYSFGHVNTTYNGITGVSEATLRQLANLKNTKPSLKVLLAIGGWGSGGFSEMARDEVKREAFAADCKRIIDATNIDGIDLDWEYPTSSGAGITASPQDKANFTLLCRDIRLAIGNNKLLTFASSADARYIDFRSVMQYIDFVNIMTYDMDSPPYHQSALHISPMARNSCETAVQAHYNAGVPYNKMALGMPFYGRTDRSLQSGDNAVSYANITGANWLGNSARTRKWDDVAKVPYIVDAAGKTICVYDDAESIAIKCRWIRERGLLGAMYWQYAQDDNNSTLRKAVFNGMTQ